MKNFIVAVSIAFFGTMFCYSQEVLMKDNNFHTITINNIELKIVQDTIIRHLGACNFLIQLTNYSSDRELIDLDKLLIVTESDDVEPLVFQKKDVSGEFKTYSSLIILKPTEKIELQVTYIVVQETEIKKIVFDD
jgi:hypothetical protein